MQSKLLAVASVVAIFGFASAATAAMIWEAPANRRGAAALSLNKGDTLQAVLNADKISLAGIQFDVTGTFRNGSVIVGYNPGIGSVKLIERRNGTGVIKADFNGGRFRRIARNGQVYQDAIANPEPSAALVFAVGLGVVALAERSRKRIAHY